jgi:hypothetical protein
MFYETVNLEVPMETPRVATVSPATPATTTEPSRNPKSPPGERRTDASATTSREDHAAISVQSQVAAARARDDAADEGGERVKAGVSARRTAPTDAASAGALAQEITRSIAAHPAVALTAQANSSGANVLAMLQ